MHFGFNRPALRETHITAFCSHLQTPEWLRCCQICLLGRGRAITLCATVQTGNKSIVYTQTYLNAVLNVFQPSLTSTTWSHLIWCFHLVACVWNRQNDLLPFTLSEDKRQAVPFLCLFHLSSRNYLSFTWFLFIFHCCQVCNRLLIYNRTANSDDLFIHVHRH